MDNKEKDWSILTEEQKSAIMTMADNYGIPPQYVVHMYEAGHIVAPWEL